ncbi:MAG TPA: alpha/beta hydrolase [Thermomicrobiales bacterium]|nr:alpha/beta hydrolase [Thermomicrobiales bacterium]
MPDYLSSDDLVGTRGMRLTIHRWPVATPKAVVVLIHGYGEHLGRYHHVVAVLNAHDYAVVGIDNRGHGRSEGRRADVVSFDDFVDDVRALVQHTREEHPDLPRFMLGHSLGGLIATRYALRHQTELAGLILSGALIQVGGSAPALVRRFAPVMARVAPTLAVVRPGRPGILSRDPDVERLFSADPLTYKGRLRARMGYQIQRAAADVQTRLDRLTLPLLVMHGVDDRMTDPQGSVLVHALARSEDKTLILWPGLRHEIFNEPERDEVLGRVTQWLDDHAVSVNPTAAP